MGVRDTAASATFAVFPWVRVPDVLMGHFWDLFRKFFTNLQKEDEYMGISVLRGAEFSLIKILYYAGLCLILDKKYFFFKILKNQFLNFWKKYFLSTNARRKSIFLKNFFRSFLCH